MPFVPFTNYGGALLRPADDRPVSNRVLDDQPIAFLVRYVGTAASGTVESDASSPPLITFKSGAVGAEVADTSVGLPTKNGVYNPADASANTAGKILDDINASTTWQAVAVDIPRSQQVKVVASIAAAQAKKPEGSAVLVIDTSVMLTASVLVAPAIFRSDIRVYEKNYAFLLGTDLAAAAQGVNTRFPFRGWRTAIVRQAQSHTYAAGTSTVKFLNEDNSNTAYVETVIHQQPGAATAVTQNNDFSYSPVIGLPNSRVIVQVVGSTTMTDGATNFLSAGGSFFRSLA